MRESETESEDSEVEKVIKTEEETDQPNGFLKARTKLSQSNLQILLSQNDILPFLKWLKQGKSGMSYDEFIQRNEKNKKVFFLFNFVEV